MFSANENILLRQHKRRIVERIERTMPEAALEMGTTVMVMQVSCKSPGCVPLETAVIIIFPKCDNNDELIPGLDGGSYKTKILKPMADVTEDDILDALPAAFEGGTRTMEKVCIFARDVMIGQITQLFGDEDDDSAVKDRKIMANFLQSCLEDYIAGRCKPPQLGEPFINSNSITNDVVVDDDTIIKKEKEDGDIVEKRRKPDKSSIPLKGNIVIRRVVEKKTAKVGSGSATTATSIRGQPPKHQRAIHEALNQQQSRNNISKLFDREHAPGVRKAGCPCCDPDNPSVIADNMMIMM